MANKESIQKLQDLIQRVVEAETDDFSALVEIAGLDPLQDFAGADLSGADLRVADLSRA
ncbi:MAG: pentapeptide repeat-containing protein, partial [Sphaerospermopsis kisseleviana]